jgi:hypothetical protein
VSPRPPAPPRAPSIAAALLLGLSLAPPAALGKKPPKEAEPTAKGRMVPDLGEVLGPGWTVPPLGEPLGWPTGMARR